MREQQVSPRTVDDLLELLRATAGRRGFVKVEVTSGGKAGRLQVGKLTCELDRISRELSVINCKLEGGNVHSIPVTPRGFRPVKEGETVAFYATTRDGVVVVRYLTRFGPFLDEGYRRFKRA